MNTYGWITPSKKIIECAAYDHFSIIDNDEFKQYFPEIKTKEDWEEREDELYTEDSNNFMDQLDPDEHPGWHNFYARKITDLLQDAGFYRFGTFTDSKNVKTMEIQGVDVEQSSYWKSFVKKNFVVDSLLMRDYRGRPRYFDI